MAKSKSFTITLHPATHERGFYMTSYTLFGDTSPKLETTAINTAHIVAQADRFATEHGKPCKASIRCHDKPKPAGFDAATTRLFYNMDEPATAAEA